jgi:hypothetical protein
MPHSKKISDQPIEDDYMTTAQFEAYEPVMMIRFATIEEAAGFCETTDPAAIKRSLSAVGMNLLIIAYGDNVFGTVRVENPTT